VDLKNPVLLLCIGFFIGIVVAESVYYVFEPMVLSDGSVEVITDRDYYPKVSELLAEADESIHIVMFSFSYQSNPQYADSNVNKLVAQLVAAKNKGIDVQVIMDDWYDHNMKSAKHLESNNIPVKILRIDGATHDKLIIIDGKVVVVGSTNWSHYAIDKNHEANVAIRDERIAQEFEEYFSTLSA
jgi:phosphatidylserine/phosphatidylglycerophosphate/cardiolipin synthase-like enzyme